MSTSICERIFAILDTDSTKKPSMLAKHLGLQNGQISAWKTRQTDPPAKYMVSIAEFLEVPVYWLITGEFESNNNTSFSSSALAVASIYDQLGEYGKRMIDTVSQLEMQRSSEKSQAMNEILNAANQARAEIDAEESV